LSLRCSWHRQLVELQTANDGIEKEQTTLFIAKGSCHLMGTAFDFAEKPLHHVISANRLPVLLGKSIESQTGIQITLEALDSTWIDLLVFLNESGHGLISGLTIFLIEQSPQFRFDLFLLFVGDEALAHCPFYAPHSAVWEPTQIWQSSH
jgi:hypothetical protein